MESETVNMRACPQSKLSRLQKTILQVLHNKYEDDKRRREKYSKPDPNDVYFYPMLSWLLAWAVAEAYEGKNYLSRNDLLEAFKENKETALARFADEAPEFLILAKRYWNQRRVFTHQLLPSFRASLSRSLKRLEARGLIRRDINRTRLRWRKPKTVGIYLTPEGRKIARQLSAPGMLAVSSSILE